MMASWDLDPLERDLPGLQAPLVLVVGSNDRTIRPSEAVRVQRLLPSARIVRLPGLGHLAHEERPAEVAELIVKLAGMRLPPDHPQRQELNDEVHARPPESLTAPSRLSFLALVSDPAQRSREEAALARAGGRRSVSHRRRRGPATTAPISVLSA